MQNDDYKYVVKNNAIYKVKENEAFNETISLENEDFIGFFCEKTNESKMWWVDVVNRIGEHLFSFDKKKIYNLFADYPYNLTKEEKEIFDKENPFWKDFFKDRRNE